MTETVVQRIFNSEDGRLVIEVRPGYELVRRYLRSDFVGTGGGVYPEIYANILRGLEDTSSDGVTGNGFTAEVSGLETVITDDYTDEELRLPTAAMKNALDAYAAWDSTGSWRPRTS